MADGFTHGSIWTTTHEIQIGLAKFEPGSKTPGVAIMALKRTEIHFSQLVMVTT